ncbi:hypothetical protein JJQ97_04660 [Pseudomonas syringae]|uniref:hypothetical protein n=1 Tax=Pseudomonas syringae TaxID=317 RepID=UPI00191716B9|nr:hypothetical protein [Pseudomonas syringae]QQQ51540.1 hypothetical protein JJQ97_04660 [Pseudomonas syringae]
MQWGESAANSAARAIGLDIRFGLLITQYCKPAVIAFAVDTAQVSILGVFYDGQDFEAVFQADLDE